jgi:hypothetical protein
MSSWQRDVYECELDGVRVTVRFKHVETGGGTGDHIVEESFWVDAYVDHAHERHQIFVSDDKVAEAKAVSLASAWFHDLLRACGRPGAEYYQTIGEGMEK